MKTLYLFVLISLTLITPLLSQAQQRTQRSLDDFNQVVVSDKIDLVLTEGDLPFITLNYVGASEGEIITKVIGKKLRIYLAGCRYGCKEQAFANTRIVAHLTYKALKKLIVMGNNEVINQGDIDTRRFVLRIMGDNNISLNSVKADRWKIAMYGDSQLSVESGEVQRMKIKSFGDNNLILDKVINQFGKVYVFGDSQLNLRVQDSIKLTVFGDATVYNEGSLRANHRLVFGDLTFESL